MARVTNVSVDYYRRVSPAQYEAREHRVKYDITLADDGSDDAAAISAQWTATARDQVHAAVGLTKNPSIAPSSPAIPAPSVASRELVNTAPAISEPTASEKDATKQAYAEKEAAKEAAKDVAAQTEKRKPGRPPAVKPAPEPEKLAISETPEDRQPPADELSELDAVPADEPTLTDGDLTKAVSAKIAKLKDAGRADASDLVKALIDKHNPDKDALQFSSKVKALNAAGSGRAFLKELEKL